MDFLTCLLIDCAKKTKHKLTQNLKEYNVTCRQAIVLRALDEVKITAKEIAEITAIDKATLSVMLKKLDANLLIKYSTGKVDGREKIYKLTTKGKNLIPKINSIEESFKEKVFSSLSKDEYEKLYLYLSKIEENM